jgi:hypothetical protein
MAMRGKVFFQLMLFAGLALGALGCKKDEFHKVYPVTGKVLVDGAPAADCLVYLHRTFDDEHPRRVSPFCTTDETGAFSINSYSVGDGAPEGEYVVTLEWREKSGMFGQNHDGPDKFDGAYAKKDVNQGKPGFVVKVGKEPLAIPTFDIKLTPEQKRKVEEIRARAKNKNPQLGGDR